MATIDDFRAYLRRWLGRNVITKIITINTIVWIVLFVGLLICGNDVAAKYAFVEVFALPGAWHDFLRHAWTLITYMFAQADFMQLVVNMLWFMMFGELLLYSQGYKRIVALYVYGGIAGAAAFILYNSWGGHHLMMGASCSTLAIVGAATALFPQMKVNLLFFGAVKLIWITVIAVVFFVILTPALDECVAHAAGLLVGVAFGLLRRKGVDICKPVSKLIDLIEGRKVSRPKISKGATSRVGSGSDTAELDQLLDKVSRSGYSSLSQAERQRLFNLSRNMRR